MRFILKALLCLLLNNYSFAQHSSLLWEISGKDLAKPSYIYGTMHWPDKRVMQLGDSVLLKLNNCQVMAGELDMTQTPSMEVVQRIMLPRDTTLKMLLHPEDYALVKKVAKKRLGLLELMVIDKCKPIYVYFILMQSENSKGKKQDVVDEYLQKEAKKNNLKVVGLESIDEQISALEAVTMPEQIKMLTDYVRYGDQSSAEMEQMIEIYIAQDLDRLDSFMVKSGMSDEMNQAVLIERNYLMAERLEKLIIKSPTFIAVGAAHLPGKEGVLELLRKEGYSVRPVISTYNPRKKKK